MPGSMGKRRWAPYEREEVREFHRGLWSSIKHERGLSQGDPIERVPGLKDSVLSLLEQEHSLEDIATMFGVVRQRVGQWLDDWGERERPNRAAAMRVFDWGRGRFTATTAREIRRMRTAVKRERELERRASIAQIALDRFVEKHSRAPYLAELAEACGFGGSPGGSPHLLSWIGVGARGALRQKHGLRAVDLLYAERGFIRPDGRVRSLRRTGQDPSHQHPEHTC
jgi:hypothetical protein